MPRNSSAAVVAVAPRGGGGWGWGGTWIPKLPRTGIPIIPTSVDRSEGYQYIINRVLG